MVAVYALVNDSRFSPDYWFCLTCFKLPLSLLSHSIFNEIISIFVTWLSLFLTHYRP